MTNHIRNTLSFRLSLTVIGALAILLIVALFIMFFFSRRALREEAISDAAQTLEATVSRIDNILLDVEQATGNIYWKMMAYHRQPEKMQLYAQRLVDVNPYIVDAHFHWPTDSFTVNINEVGWVTPQRKKLLNGEPLTTFRLPIWDGQKAIGVLDVSVSLTQLTKIMLESKPSPNSFYILLGKDGKLIVFPDSAFLNKNAFELAEKYDNNAELEAIHAMTSGESGYRHVRMEGRDCYVFYKPFVRADVPGRAQIDLGWSAGIIYPEEDIFGEYNRLLNTVFIIAIIGLLLLLVSCRLFIHRQLVPLRQLAVLAQRIADGSYDDPIPDIPKQDEIGRLNRHFQNMQQSLVTRVGELQRASDLLKERGEVLQTAYEQAQAGDRMKTNFLYNMSDQMTSPVSDICKCVMTISDRTSELSEEETNRLVDEIQQRGEKITALLNQLITESERIMGN
jgi:methyl-accepting chemotaxis protein/sigma-B regulation protein RsbU (phosphoserine phosphatase)